MTFEMNEAQKKFWAEVERRVKIRQAEGRALVQVQSDLEDEFLSKARLADKEFSVWSEMKARAHTEAFKAACDEMMLFYCSEAREARWEAREAAKQQAEIEAEYNL